MPLELQGVAILGHNPHAVFGDAVGDFDVNFEGDFGFCAEQAGEVRDDLLSDAPRVPTHARWVKFNRPVKTAQ